MKARCVDCGRMWGISLYQEISSSGYICPVCAGKEKAPCGSGVPTERTKKHINNTIPEKEEAVKYVRGMWL